MANVYSNSNGFMTEQDFNLNAADNFIIKGASSLPTAAPTRRGQILRRGANMWHCDGSAWNPLSDVIFEEDLPAAEYTGAISRTIPVTGTLCFPHNGYYHFDIFAPVDELDGTGGSIVITEDPLLAYIQHPADDSTTKNTLFYKSSCSGSSGEAHYNKQVRGSGIIKINHSDDDYRVVTLYVPAVNNTWIAISAVGWAKFRYLGANMASFVTKS